MATSLTTLNVSPLAFLPADKWYAHRRTYAYGQILPLVVPLNRISCFIFSRDAADTGTNFVLVNYNTGVETNIHSLLLVTGLSGYTVDGKGMVTYPGSVNLPGVDFTEDLYYLRCEDDMGNFIFSEIFAWQRNLDNNQKYLKIEWWHFEDFTYPGGTIRYDFPFKLWAYIYTDIGKPERMKEETVEPRDGREFPLKQISWKVFKFEFRAPEYFVDAIDLVWQHDACEITHMGRVYEVEKLVMNTEWLEYGDFARVGIEFRTDTVVVVNGRSYTDLDYEVAECGCFVTNYEAIAWITFGSAEYTGKFWTDEFGANHSFVSGEYVVIIGELPGVSVLKQFNGTTYISISINARETICLVHDSRTGLLARESNYFYRKSGIGGSLGQVPDILSTGNVGSIYTISGDTFENTIIELWIRTDDGDVLYGTYTDDQFEAGISFDATGANAYFVRARTYICPNIGESDTVALEGIGFDEIGIDEIN